MTTRSTRSQSLKTPTAPTANQQSIKNFLLNNKKPAANQKLPNRQILLNDKKQRSPKSDADIEFVRTESEPTEHYVLTEFKGDDEEDNEIDFVLTDNIQIANEGPVAECIEIEEQMDVNGSDDVDDVDEMIVQTQEFIEHVCGKCYKSFRTLKALKRHIAFCVFSAELVSRREEMLKNIDKIEKEALHMHKKDICFCCGDSYDTCHGGHINCGECPKTFKTQLSLERHMFLIHSEKNDFPCEICNGRIRTQVLLDLHTEQHLTRGKPYACKICGKDFTRQYHLRRHLNFSSCGETKADMVSCKVCGKEFARLDNLRSHLKTHLGQDKGKKNTDYACPCCKKCFYSLSTLNIHIRTHTGERPFDCDLCDKNFPSLVALKKHRRYHTGEKPYTCSVCKATFSVKEVLNRHMKRHTGEKPHGCDECGKRFIQATQLRNHLKTHLRPHECTECPEKFKTENQLNNHVRKQHRVPRRKGGKNSINDDPKSRKKYNCEDCSLSFPSVSSFLRHEASQTHMENAKKHCKVCGLEFKNTKALQFHVLKYHETSMDDSSQNNFETVKTENDGQVILEEYFLESIPEVDPKELPEKPLIQSFTVIEKDNESALETVKPKKLMSKSSLRSELRKSMAECLRETNEKEAQLELEEEELLITENVRKLLDMLVDSETLTKFGWPTDSVENVLCKVIENCGYNMLLTIFTDDYCTRMREYVKLLFTVVIQNDTIKELLNNYPIDEVIDFVLSNDDEEEDD